MSMLSRICMVLMLLLLFSCRHKQVANVAPVQAPARILTGTLKGDTMEYITENLNSLNRRYTAYDTAGNVIKRLDFFRLLISGNYIFSKDSTGRGLSYKLGRLNAAGRKTWGDMISGYAQERYDNYRWVGRQFPPFDFIDIDGRHYNSANTRGKIVVLKYWFVGCKACREEMPALNTLMAKYKSRDDMVFISIAPDNTSRLRSFFNTHPFNYIKVPDQGYFISRKLKIQEAPTHFVIDKQGVVVNEMNNAEELAYALKEDI